jgi:hypothetical protein
MKTFPYQIDRRKAESGTKLVYLLRCNIREMGA